MKATKVNKVNQGTYFKLQDTETAPVWVRGEYIREAGKQNELYDKLMENNKTLSEALPELEAIAKELGVKVNNGKVLEEYFKRHPEEKSK